MKLLFIVCFVVPLWGADPLVSRTQLHMGTFVKISLPESRQYLFEEAFGVVKAMDTLFSTYKPRAYAYRLNALKRLDVPADFIKLLKLSSKIYYETQGYFSVAIGSITKKQYHFGEKKGDIPSKSNLDKAQTELSGIIIKDNKVVLKSGTTLDFGGIAKGYAVDKVHKLLKAKGVKRFQVALSGDIYCQGLCDIAIQSPFRQDAVVKVLKLHDAAITTSGNYERFIGSKKHNHLINPKTKRSQQEIASMTLYSNSYDNATLDALATALSVMPQKNRMQLLQKHPKIAYYFITVDGTVFQRP